MLLAARYWSALVSRQYWQLLVAAASQSRPPAAVMYGCMYSPQVLPAGGLKTLNSAVAHSMLRSCKPVDVIPAIKYVSGEARYIKIQKPGRALGGCMTPLKVRVIINIRVAMVPPVSASGSAEITNDANVEVKM